jgi:hypothetical protein
MMNLCRYAAITGKKAVDNPHRSVGYFVGTVMTLPTLGSP